jgi:hypothetical protein
MIELLCPNCHHNVAQILAWTKSSNEGLVRAKESTNLQKLFAAAMENQQTLLFPKNEGKRVR